MIDWRRIDHVQVTIPSDAMEAAREFYGDVLGLAERDQPDSFGESDTAWFRAGDVEVHLAVEPARERSRRHPAFEVADVAVAAVRKHGPAVPGLEEVRFVLLGEPLLGEFRRALGD